jgi:hypothetical protein
MVGSRALLQVTATSWPHPGRDLKAAFVGVHMLWPN